MVLASCRAGTHVLIMTHDHAEDVALCDAALRLRRTSARIGLIGSAAKWARFRRELAAEGHDEAAIARITCPIGLPEHRRQGARGDRRRASRPAADAWRASGRRR